MMKNMQLTSKIHKICELKTILNDNESTNDTLVDIYKKFAIKPINTFFDNVKTKGIAVTGILFSLILTRLLNVTVRAMLISGQNNKNEIEKDTYYRLKNNENIDWRRLLYRFVNRYLSLITKHTNETTSSMRCFIIDDSFLEKTGKKIEFIGKVFDHVTKKTLLGFKMLTLGFWDGKSFNPIDFSLHREYGNKSDRPYGMKKSELAEQYTKRRDKKSAGAKRIKELDSNKIKNAILMIKRAVKHGLTANYVLMDAWFVSELMIKEIRLIKKGMLHLLGMCRMDKRKYLYNYKELTAKGLLNKYKKTKQNIRCRRINSRYINLVVEYKEIRLQLFFTKYSGQKDWNLLITTDLNLSYIKAIEIYQLRWSIEVFFKESKQYLQLGKSQSNDFDAQIADTTISIIVYMMLNLRKRFSDYETIGEVFRDENKLMCKLTLWERLWGLFLELAELLLELFEIDIEVIMEKMVKGNSDQEKIILVLEKLKELQFAKNAA